MNTTPFKFKTTNIIIPKGKYVISDPCYFYPDSDWMALINRKFIDGHSIEGVHRDEEGNEFIIVDTKYGDGRYDLKRRGAPIGNLSVDAGCISIIPFEVAERWAEIDDRKGFDGVPRRSQVIELLSDESFEFGDGNFSFGPFSVNTGENEDGY